jgi:hypothetical protein
MPEEIMVDSALINNDRRYNLSSEQKSMLTEDFRTFTRWGWCLEDIETQNYNDKQEFFCGPEFTSLSLILASSEFQKVLKLLSEVPSGRWQVRNFMVEKFQYHRLERQVYILACGILRAIDLHEGRSEEEMLDAKQILDQVESAIRNQTVYGDGHKHIEYALAVACSACQHLIEGKH